MKQNKKLIIAAVAAVLLVVIMAAIYIRTRPGAVGGAKTITVEVVHGDKTTKTFTYHTDAEYLGEALLTEGLVAGDEGEFGLYINTVDGEDADYEKDGSYWALFEGGDYAQQGISLTPIANGSSFSLIYTVG